ncbi:type I-F CRISPR-associated helicase Cas3f [Acinetobacter rathckeae]|uniref:type I-F CRISPR-associated helicase Cas3f n=1 Tax=Acinetobacter rathckeae TaxID=2605272 RepID=UPI0018A2EFAC|nr:type I-F CRISPR-associated helicase Cas3f [Acinetobacter rathckeae]MBF7689125.1 type I-F CRISPR-associated helicase Cas3 [Acinetobacter rathckeae]MBF7695433.1 type I-F CRISPR-associated helicase Cas3 [Acinetobacter rathckeae]
MHILIQSACEKRALKKTRAVLDSYAIRTGQSTWQAPMTMEGLKEIRTALKRTATRQTAVVAYINYGTRRMKRVWVVGSKQKFNLEGAYPIASTKKPYKQQQIPAWVRVASLLAGAAGDVHDLGKASQHFQHKLMPQMASSMVRDDIRHEWLSVKLLQQLRKNDWHWQDAWKNLTRGLSCLTLGDRKVTENDQISAFLLDVFEAVDYLVVTHHGLLGGDKNWNPDQSLHVRNNPPNQAQLSCAGEIDATIFKSHQHRMARVIKMLDGTEDVLYWKALAFYARVALIHADHVVSAEQYSVNKPEGIRLFANTKLKEVGQNKKQKLQDQPLNWHLQQVGDRAAYFASKMTTDLSMAGLSEQTVEYICQPATSSRFQWQNVVANALHKHIQKMPDTPCLMLNIAGTGSGKTRMNLRAACTLRPEDPRIAIALNLRSLTLQTGDALKSSMNLSDDEIAIIIGDHVSQKLFSQREKNDVHVDDDENISEPMFDAYGEEQHIPNWLNPLFTKTVKGKKVIDKTARTVLAAPLLVSTIDYLIAAGEPQKQGHHVKACLRVMSSDLVLDEIDSYDPKALMAVLRLVQLAALHGRHVICSSATLSETVADSIYRAFASGIEMRAALNKQPEKFILALVDNELKPKVSVQSSHEKSDFLTRYKQHLSDLQQILLQKSAQPYRLATLAEMPVASIVAWKETILTQIKMLHEHHCWQVKKTKTDISFGLIRVANIKHAIALAKYLSAQLPHAKVACYHANDWIISRFHKEQCLDYLLARHKNGSKRPTGNEHIYNDDSILSFIQASDSDSIPFIVIATPVEEVGRDHDFDWAVIDASSTQSIVQTAGRVNRHRLNVMKQPNIAIPQFNYRYCANEELAQPQKKAVFTRPGYEGYAKLKTYQTQDLQDLLPWNEDQQLVIDARLRFDTGYCLFAKNDDQQIKAFNEKFFASSGYQLFSNPQTYWGLMTEQIYVDTCLRDKQRKEVYHFNDDGDLNFYHHTGLIELNPQTGRYEECIRDADFNIQTAPDNAWLYLTPVQLQALCLAQGIHIEDGCKVSLTVYREDIPNWAYHIAFGLCEV